MNDWGVTLTNGRNEFEFNVILAFVLAKSKILTSKSMALEEATTIGSLDQTTNTSPIFP